MQFLPRDAENQISADGKTSVRAEFQSRNRLLLIMKAPQPLQVQGGKALDPEADPANPPGSPEFEMPGMKGIRVGFNAHLRALGKGEAVFEDFDEDCPLLRSQASRRSPSNIKGIDDRLRPHIPFPGRNLQAECFQVTLNVLLLRLLAVKGAIAAFPPAERDVQIAG